MRLAVSVVSPATRRTADVVLEADSATPMADIAAELERFIADGRGGQLRAPPGGVGGGGQPGARVLRFPGPRSQGSLAMSSPLPNNSPLPDKAPVQLYVGCQLVPLHLTWPRRGSGTGR